LPIQVNTITGITFYFHTYTCNRVMYISSTSPFAVTIAPK
jgi:hypothetical protein